MSSHSPRNTPLPPCRRSTAAASLSPVTESIISNSVPASPVPRLLSGCWLPKWRQRSPLCGSHRSFHPIPAWSGRSSRQKAFLRRDVPVTSPGRPCHAIVRTVGKTSCIAPLCMLFFVLLPEQRQGYALVAQLSLHFDPIGFAACSVAFKGLPRETAASPIRFRPAHQVMARIDLPPGHAAGNPPQCFGLLIQSRPPHDCSIRGRNLTSVFCKSFEWIISPPASCPPVKKEIRYQSLSRAATPSTGWPDSTGIPGRNWWPTCSGIRNFSPDAETSHKAYRVSG